MQNKYFSEIIEEFYKNILNGNKTFFFVNTSTAENIISNFINTVYSDNEKFSSVYLCSYTKSIVEAYFPFLPIIKEFFNDYSIEKTKNLLKELDIYPAHFNTFLSFLQNNNDLRYDFILHDEINYEKELFQNFIIRIIKKISKIKPIIIIIKDINLLPKSSFDLLIKIINNKKIKNIYLFSTFKNIEDTISNNWHSFTNIVEKKTNFISIDDELEKESKLNNNLSVIMENIETTLYKIDNEKKFQKISEYNNLSKAGFDSVTIDIMQKNINFLSPENNSENFEVIYNLCTDNNNIIIDQTEFNTFLLLGVDSFIMEKTYDKAFIYTNILHKKINSVGITSEKDKKCICEIYYRLSLIEFYRDNIEAAINNANIMLKIVSNYKDDMLKIKAYFLLFHVKQSITAYTKDFHNFFKDIYIPLYNMLEQKNLHNTLSSILTHSGYLVSISRDEETGFEKALEFCKTGIKIAEENNNKFRIADGYRALGIIFQNAEAYDLALKNYYKAERIIKKNFTENEIVAIMNSIGYFEFSIGDYNKSYAYYRRILKILDGSKRYEDFCSTFYNIAKIYIFTDQYSKALKYINNMLDIMNILSIKNFPYHPRVNIYSLAGICYIKLSRRVKASEMLYDIENLNDYKRNAGTFPYYKLLKALISKEHGYYNDALDNLNGALRLKNREDLQFELLLYKEFGLLYEKFDKLKDANLNYQKGLKLIGDRNIHLYFKNFFVSKMTNKRVIDKQFKNFHEYKLNYDTILEFARQDKNLNLLHKKMSEINLLRNIQEITTTLDNRKELIHRVLGLLHTRFLFEQTYFITKNKSSFDISHKLGDLSINQEIIINVCKKSSDKEDIITNHELFKNQDIESLINIPFLHNNESDETSIEGNLIAIIKNSENKFNKDDLKVLSVATRQMTNAINLLKANKQLLKSATIDSLTEVYNRHEIMKKLENEIDRISRYKTQAEVSVLFIDLDNFKYYNDTFGHNTGDIILQEFAGILKDSIRNIDIIGRFGGDEFIIVLPETNSENASIVARRIIDKMKNCNYFTNSIENELKREIHIPDKKTLGCSIGIARYDEKTDKSYKDLLARADKMLYAVKESGKNNYKM